MKKNKKNAQQNTNMPSYLENRKKRREEELQKQAQKREKSRNALFRRRVNDASEKKVIKTLRTKAYYRFSENYPSVVSIDGFRENEEKKPKLSSGKKIFLALSLIVFFCLGFILTSVGLEISKKDYKSQQTLPVVTDVPSIKAFHFSFEDLRDKPIEQLKSELKNANCNTALFEFKSEKGYVYFDTNSFVGGSADRKIAGAWDKVQALSQDGIDVAAYISCFKDSIASSSLSGMEVLSTTGALFIDKNGDSWLDPFSQTANDYLLDLIKKAADGGFKYIVLDNISFPTLLSSSSPVFKGDTDAPNSKNIALRTFINNAYGLAGENKISVLCDLSGFCNLTQIPSEKYGGTLLDTKVNSYILDLREEYQDKKLLLQTDYFNYIEEMPLTFFIDAGDLAIETTAREKEAYTLTAITNKDVKDAEKYISYSGINNIIYW